MCFVLASTFGLEAQRSPPRLMQTGKRAIIGRIPIFIRKPGFVGLLAEEPSWWGFATFVSEVDVLLEGTGLRLDEQSGISYVLYSDSVGRRRVLAASHDLRDSLAGASNESAWLAEFDGRDYVEETFVIPALSVRWVLITWPSHSWETDATEHDLQVGLCVVFSLFSGLSLYCMLVRESVRREVAELLADCERGTMYAMRTSEIFDFMSSSSTTQVSHSDDGAYQA